MTLNELSLGKSIFDSISANINVDKKLYKYILKPKLYIDDSIIYFIVLAFYLMIFMLKHVANYFISALQFDKDT